MHRSMIALALLLIATQVGAQVYKWKDASGTVHYSQTPPPGAGTKFKQMKPDLSAPPASAASTAAPAPTSTAATPPPATMADTPENRAKLCASLKTNLAALQGTAPVVMQQDGKQTALDDSARKQQASAAQAQYQQYCVK